MMSLELRKNGYPNDLGFEFYVVNWDINAKRAEMYNIFNNSHVYRNAVELTKDYVEGRIKTRKEFADQLGKVIQWQEWSRVQYEVAVGDPFPRSVEELQKIDCWMQAIANIDLIADMCIRKYEENVKI